MSKEKLALQVFEDRKYLCTQRYYDLVTKVKLLEIKLRVLKRKYPHMNYDQLETGYKNLRKSILEVEEILNSYCMI